MYMQKCSLYLPFHSHPHKVIHNFIDKESVRELFCKWKRDDIETPSACEAYPERELFLRVGRHTLVGHMVSALADIGRCESSGEM
jgi:hypothetical protein